MRNNLVLGAAIAAALAGGSAVAGGKLHANGSSSVDVYVSGASVMQSFFSSDLQAGLCGGASVATATYLDTAYTTYEPNFAVYQCTNATTSTTYTLHYSAELGSSWGVYEAAYPTTTRQYLTPTAAACPAGSFSVAGKTSAQTGAVWPTPGSTSYCTATGYNHVTDSVAVNTNNVLTPAVADIVVSDFEPDLFVADNWESANFDPTLRPAILGSTAPNAAAIAAATNLLNPTIGEVYQVIAHGIPGYSDGTAQSATPFNLSSSSLRSILTGEYKHWKQVPEVGTADSAAGGTPINICRRDHGAGVQIGADITFSGQTCNLTTGGGVSGTEPLVKGNVTAYSGATPPWVYESPSNTDVKNCVASAPGTIGLIGSTKKDTGFSYTILYVDGYAPSTHNAGAGLYRYAYEVNMAATGTGSGNATVAGELVTDASNWSALNTDGFTKESGAFAANGTEGGWVSSTIGGAVNYTIPGADGGTGGVQGTGSTWAASGVTVEALFDRGQDNCTVQTNNNN
jgi:hypothetical protein